jgi:uncharacterized protein YndB with AHSA1/START domain
MPTVTRSRTVPASPDRVWQVVGDPHHMPRWWPLVKRMEDVSPDGFTQVLGSSKGRLYRADYQTLVSEPPEGEQAAGRCVWALEVEGSPWERYFQERTTELVLEPENGRTRVTISLIQRPRGYSHTGGFMLRRAARRMIDEALEGLDGLFAA